MFFSDKLCKKIYIYTYKNNSASPYTFSIGKSEKTDKTRPYLTKKSRFIWTLVFKFMQIRDKPLKFSLEKTDSSGQCKIVIY